MSLGVNSKGLGPVGKITQLTTQPELTRSIDVIGKLEVKPIIKSMKLYVLGFAFTEQGKVVLIRKRRPEFQLGKLNGVGGKIEPGETPLQAMQREFYEEAGVKHRDWQEFGVMGNSHGDDGSGSAPWRCWLFRTWLPLCAKPRTMTDEEIVLVDPEARLDTFNVMINLNWLIPLALHRENPRKNVVIEYI